MTVRIGVNLSTAASPAAEIVRAARLAEQLGFDFLSCTDHPAAPDPCNEVWTQLAWVAAATTRIRVAPRVLGAPFRNPVIVAKMAETLNRLSGGRLILGFGAGGSDEELQALGVAEAHRRAKLSAMVEAIHIIRGVWREADFSSAGTYHQASAASIAPRPTSPIPIWLGTFGPRALASTGALADGWIPSLGYVPASRLPDMLRQVRSAAAEAGRTASAVEAILNVVVQVETAMRRSNDAIIAGPAEFLTEQLVKLLDVGFDGFNFIVVGDAVDEQQRVLADEVVPLLREH